MQCLIKMLLRKIKEKKENYCRKHFEKDAIEEN